MVAAAKRAEKIFYELFPSSSQSSYDMLCRLSEHVAISPIFSTSPGKEVKKRVRYIEHFERQVVWTSTSARARRVYITRMHFFLSSAIFFSFLVLFLFHTALGAVVGGVQRGEPGKIFEKKKDCLTVWTARAESAALRRRPLFGVARRRNRGILNYEYKSQERSSLSFFLPLADHSASTFRETQQ